MVRDFNLALSGDKTYRLEPAAMLIQEQNLRLTELVRIFSTCGVDALGEWIVGHPE
jgi:hypothetical protein